MILKCAVVPSTNNQPCWLYGIFSPLTHTSCNQQCCFFSHNSFPWLNGFWTPVPCTGSEDSWGDEAIKCFSQIVPESSCPPFFLSAHPSAAHGCWCNPWTCSVQLLFSILAALRVSPGCSIRHLGSGCTACGPTAGGGAWVSLAVPAPKGQHLGPYLRRDDALVMDWQTFSAKGQIAIFSAL